MASAIDGMVFGLALDSKPTDHFFLLTHFLVPLLPFKPLPASYPPSLALCCAFSLKFIVSKCLLQPFSQRKVPAAGFCNSWSEIITVVMLESNNYKVGAHACLKTYRLLTLSYYSLVVAVLCSPTFSMSRRWRFALRVPHCIHHHLPTPPHHRYHCQMC
jgi:hypothetical protein